MRRAIVFLMVLAVAGVLVSAQQTQQGQQKAVSFKKLQEFLPKIDLAGFTKGKPGGQTTTVMGISTSEATLEYKKPGDEDAPTIEVKISDMAGVPYTQLGLSVIGTTEFENQTDTGYEKSTKIQGFPGRETVDNTEDGKSAEIQVVVGGRFIVELDADGTNDIALLRKLIDSMNLAELAKVTQ